MGVWSGVLVCTSCLLYHVACRSATHARSAPQVERISLFESLVVPAVGSKTRQRKVCSFVELELVKDDFESLCAPRRILVGAPTSCGSVGAASTPDHVVQNAVIHILDMVRQVFWLSGDFVVPWFQLFPLLPLSYCFFLSQREVFLSYGLVICKRRECGREKLSVAILPSQ